MSDPDRHVVIVSQMFSPEPGGNAARIHDVATHLDGDSWQVSVLSPPPSHPPGSFERSRRRSQTESIDGVTVHRLWTYQPITENPGLARRLPYYLLFGIHAAIWLLWHVREYDIVVTSTPPISTGAPGLVASVFGKLWVVDVRDLWIDASVSLGYLDGDGWIERVSRAFQNLVLCRADRITVTTETLGRRLSDRYDASIDDKWIVIPNGVDTVRFRPGIRTEGGTDRIVDEPVVTVASQSSNANRWPTTTDDTPEIVYTGNLGSAQDLETCIRAMAHLSDKRAVLRLVGGGDEETTLRELVDELGVDDRVEFAGVIPREDVPDVLNRATIGVAPLADVESLSYAIPTKVYEYMACALPTVVTGRGEIERFVTESGGGVHVPNDPERLAAQLDELLENPRLRMGMSRRGRQHVVESYDRQVIARQLRAEIARLAGTPRTGNRWLDESW